MKMQATLLTLAILASPVTFAEQDMIKCPSGAEVQDYFIQNIQGTCENDSSDVVDNYVDITVAGHAAHAGARLYNPGCAPRPPLAFVKLDPNNAASTMMKNLEYSKSSGSTYAAILACRYKIVETNPRLLAADVPFPLNDQINGKDGYLNLSMYIKDYACEITPDKLGFICNKRS